MTRSAVGLVLWIGSLTVVPSVSTAMDYAGVVEGYVSMREQALAHGVVCGDPWAREDIASPGDRDALTFHDPLYLCVSVEAAQAPATWARPRAAEVDPELEPVEPPALSVDDPGARERREAQGAWRELAMHLRLERRAARREGDRALARQLREQQRLLRPLRRPGIAVRPPAVLPETVEIRLPADATADERLQAVVLGEIVLTGRVRPRRLPRARVRLPSLELKLGYPDVPPDLPAGARLELSGPLTAMPPGLDGGSSLIDSPAPQPVRVIVRVEAVGRGTVIEVPGRGLLLIQR